MQPKLRLNVGLLYECANPECFYVEALMSFDEVSWVHYWNHDLGDLDLRAVCASCREPLMIWHDSDEDRIAGLVTATQT